MTYEEIFAASKAEFVKNDVSHLQGHLAVQVDITGEGEGAFYTLKNLVMFHGCGIKVDGHIVYGAAAMSVLNKRLNEYKGEGWRMFALMKKAIKDNNFDFHKRMNEIYND